MSGNATLTIIAGMLHEITVRHTAFVIKERREVSKADYEKLMRSYRRLMKLLRSGDGAAAEAHWRKHLDTAREPAVEGARGRQGPRRHAVVGAADHVTWTGTSSAHGWRVTMSATRTMPRSNSPVAASTSRYACVCL